MFFMLTIHTQAENQSSRFTTSMQVLL